MPFHLCANTLLIGAVADTDVPALSDDILPVNANNHFLMPQDLFLAAAMCMSATIIRAWLGSASLRQITQPNIRPVIAGALPGNIPNSMWQPDAPLRIPQGDELVLKATANPGTTEQLTALFWLSLGLDPVPNGDLICARCTSTTAAVANKWTSIVYTFDQNIPPGRYALVGSEHISTNGIAHRFIIPNQVWRPGAVSGATATYQPHLLFQTRRLGKYGEFQNTVPPIVQVLCNAADAVHTLFLYIVKVG